MKNSGDHANGLNVSTAIMHHPRRADLIPGLLRACGPLRPRVVTDPRPEGPPSPLRTAKLAWSAVADGATHHLVLQDDVQPMRGFAVHLYRALAAARPHGLTLYVHGKSPQNAHLVRRATIAGVPCAPLCPQEWTPTLGLALPAAAARELAAYLAALPDELLDDDDYVTDFCNAQGVRVLAAVPNLLEHRDSPSLSGYDDERERYATVFGAGWRIPAEYWRARSGSYGQAQPSRADYAIELRHSRCQIRLRPPGTSEPLLHPYGWYWHDWCALIGADGEQVLSGYERARRTWRPGVVPERIAAEVWAAGYLLGGDAAAAYQLPGRGGARTPLGTVMVRRMAEAWIGCGLSAADRAALTEPARAALADLCLAAIRSGARSPHPSQPARSAG